MNAQWHFTEKGEQRGPITAAELKARAASGILRPDDLVWKEGMAKWVPASKVQGLLATPQTASPSPPPLPSIEAEVKTTGVLDALKTTGQFAAKHADRTRLATVSLNGAYHRLGKSVYENKVGRDALVQQFSALDALKHQTVAPAPVVEPTVKPQGLAQQAKAMAKATADAAQRKVAKTRFDHALITLGKTAYEKRNEFDLPQQETAVIESLPQQVATIDAEIGTISAQRPGQALVDATLHSTSQVGRSLINNRIVHTVLTIGCVPIGLFLIWRSEQWSRRAKWTWTGAVAGIFIFGMYSSVVETKAMKASLAQATAAWDLGQEADAIGQYRALLDDHWFRLNDVDRATALRRVVEFDVNHDNESAARALLEKALRNNVEVTLENDKARQLLGTIRSESAVKQGESEIDTASNKSQGSPGYEEGFASGQIFGKGAGTSCQNALEAYSKMSDRLTQQEMNDQIAHSVGSFLETYHEFLAERDKFMELSAKNPSNGGYKDLAQRRAGFCDGFRKAWNEACSTYKLQSQ